MLPVRKHMIYSNTEHPGAKPAFLPEIRQMGHYFNQYLLACILCIRNRSQHTKGQVKHHVLHISQEFLQCVPVPRRCQVNQPFHIILFLFLHSFPPPFIKLEGGHCWFVTYIYKIYVIYERIYSSKSDDRYITGFPAAGHHAPISPYPSAGRGAPQVYPHA
jgi:hypothetical protein